MRACVRARARPCVRACQTSVIRLPPQRSSAAVRQRGCRGGRQQRTDPTAADSKLLSNSLELDDLGAARGEELEEVVAEQPERLVLAAHALRSLRLGLHCTCCGRRAHCASPILCGSTTPTMARKDVARVTGGSCMEELASQTVQHLGSARAVRGRQLHLVGRAAHLPVRAVQLDSNRLSYPSTRENSTSMFFHKIRQTENSWKQSIKKE